MSFKRTHLAAWCLSALAATTITSHARGVTERQSQAEKVALSVNDGRPLAKMVRLIEDRYNWTITYEDPALLAAGDINDVTALNPRVGRQGKRLLVPLGGSFEFLHSPPRLTGPQPVGKPEVLAALLSQYRGTGLPGTFAIRTDGELAHIVPVGTRDSLSRPIAYSAPLDQRVSIASAPRDGLQMIAAIVDAVKQKGERKFGFASGPTSLLLRSHGDWSADNEVARTVLSRVLTSIDKRLSWRVFCEPGPERYCLLNVHAIEPGGAGRD